jgi:hypothetical protein
LTRILPSPPKFGTGTPTLTTRTTPHYLRSPVLTRWMAASQACADEMPSPASLSSNVAASMLTIRHPSLKAAHH